MILDLSDKKCLKVHCSRGEDVYSRVERQHLHLSRHETTWYLKFLKSLNTARTVCMLALVEGEVGDGGRSLSLEVLVYKLVLYFIL